MFSDKFTTRPIGGPNFILKLPTKIHLKILDTILGLKNKVKEAIKFYTNQFVMAETDSFNRF
jgi:hypothetical protein